ncbi:FAD/NAD(P)-binding protein [Fructilactobacillus myrtifloralis]|uniref:FAD/NAD(P)-binding protein n=1 Tax=Fructilactobacillus myrtifloralis TaxID=2940301 RepID=A0ABY5BPT9_9LACO|nr:FAD/NAD(P)-binding protein [Fructilactobacillus myrtifloralis]USS85724.1 FAD/NAD(P)-binding protein [Fructilactobacillus myrtifloralis]
MNIGLIGAGPRGILILANLQQHCSADQPLHVDWFDPAPIGGAVWDPNQDPTLIMNSPAQLVTLYNDYDHEKLSGPTFYQWTQSAAAQPFLQQQRFNPELATRATTLQPNDYAPRALFGAYAQWVTEQLLAKLPAGLTVTYHQTAVTNLTSQSAGYLVHTATATYPADQIVLSTGNTPNQLGPAETALADYGTNHGLLYLGPDLPDQADLTAVQPQQPVIIRGLGLSFFDYVTKLTTGRGGYFTETSAHQLEYHPSGQEPQIIAGSRRGVPYYPKTINQDQVGETHPHYFLTPANIDQHLVNGHLPGAVFLELLQAEIELRYYQILLANQGQSEKALNDFTTGFVAASDRAQFVQSAGIPAAERWNWDTILNPVAGTKIETTHTYQQTLLKWMDQIMTDAQRGSHHAPITGALTLVIELRPLLQQLVITGKFPPDDYVHDFLGRFVPSSSFLTAGPPLLRYRQLAALIKAQIVTIVGPQLRIVGAQQQFNAFSHFYPKELFHAPALLEARVPNQNLERTASPLLENLRQQGLVRPATLPLKTGQLYQSGAVDVDLATYQARQSDGRLVPGLFIWGLPLSGLEWMTTALPHPSANDHNFAVANLITEQLLAPQ